MKRLNAGNYTIAGPGVRAILQFGNRRYYLPVSNKAARNQGRQLVSGLLFLLANLFRLAGIMLVAVCSLLFMTFRLLWKATKS
ncbi:MAG: hypothetical protein J0H29_04955 [Sphingobacteriales bacterium]|nr:hypothetical protein [Sphingobacteriales bacterium]OJY86225.1 MAG: hypothetical protein BGP14_17290 [Sphingobacteriales bacterium 44-15]